MSIYLDTHAVVWLYAGLADKFTARGRALINQHDVLVSPIVQLELQYLYEIQRVAVEADALISELQQQIGLQLCTKPFTAIVQTSLPLRWTRDPFDRLIVANAQLNNTQLLSVDKLIQANYANAVW